MAMVVDVELRLSMMFLKENSSLLVGFEFGLLDRTDCKAIPRCGLDATCDNRYLKYVTNNVSYEKIRNFDPLNFPLPRFLR
jgi:hypothetical protein